MGILEQKLYAIPGAFRKPVRLGGACLWRMIFVIPQNMAALQMMDLQWLQGDMNWPSDVCEKVSDSGKRVRLGMGTLE